MTSFLERLSQYLFRHSRIIRWWFNLTLSHKLILAFLISALINLSSGGFAYYLALRGGKLVTHIETLLIFSTLASLLIFLYGLYISFLTSRPLRHAVDFADTLAKGDLTPTLSSLTKTDEIGKLCQSLGIMLENFRSLVENISYGVKTFQESSQTLGERVEVTASAAKQISQCIDELAQGSQNQSQDNNLQAILSTIEKMSAGIEQIDQSVSLADQASTQALTLANKGDQAITETNAQMLHIHQTVDETGTIISELGEKSSSIQTIVATIKAISDQTNLLSLNAAIEAARAGEHGRGFSVVADEVRKLAEQSNQSSVQIEQIILDIKHNVDRAIASMTAEKDVVRNGVKIIEEAQKTFNKIMETTQIVNRQVKEVAQFARNIADNSHDIFSKIEQVGAIIKETTLKTEEVASGSLEQMKAMMEINTLTEELQAASRSLQESTEKFKLE
ncbi:methyl-accepting chemotaxis protein McpA [Desulfosporosinus acididurans]|uniref:Methyl-accepting chemotaxis protein McpA n=1 Tax=Desulfosporosinus acididurans TaxID=476652 RepID=A0A0J1FKX6_9FIRM|nr:HAMP domain-containing methyl-accepting chemotaxis protein [Desulfosporosinus acididurans]KLU64130.1 methyl-accepting chemotaxis protein McpA [Desulfosporosinus acididurans]